MHTVLRAFVTTVQRFHPGDVISPEQCNSLDHFEALCAAGYIDEAEPPAADEAEPPAAAPSDPLPSDAD